MDRAKRRLKTIHDDYIARLFHKECRIDLEDVIIGSFPKSGRTWVRFFIGSYISLHYDLGINVNWRNFTRLSPGYLCNKEDGLLMFPKSIPRVIFSHRRSIGRYFPDRAVVFVTRRFLDILVSYYFFHKHRDKTSYKDLGLNDFVRNEFDFAEAIDRINYFSRQMEKARATLIIPYEALKVNPEKWFRRLISFTDYDYDEEAFFGALEHSSFSSMREMERKQKGYDSEEAFHTRKGAVGEAADRLDEETKTHVQDLLERNLRGVLREYYLGREIESSRR